LENIRTPGRSDSLMCTTFYPPSMAVSVKFSASNYFAAPFFGVFAKFAQSNNYIRHVSLSVIPLGTTLLPNEGFSWNMTGITDTLHEELFTFMIVSRSIRRMRNVTNKGCRMVKTFFENPVVHQRM
jgi:hypothetical protein